MRPPSSRSTRRKRLRLTSYDYSGPGPYFVTVCTCRQRLFLGKILEDQMYNSKAGDTVNLVWESLPIRFPQLELDKFQTMPNHFHGILGIRRSPDCSRVNLGKVIGTFKSQVTVKYCEGVRTAGWHPFEKSFWQRGFHDRIIRSDIEYKRIWEYIDSNPRRWQLDHLNVERTGMGEFDGWLNEQGQE